MTLIRDAEKLAPADLLPHQQILWQQQRQYVMAYSGFYNDLWKGQAPPMDLLDLPSLPLSSKPQLRLSVRPCAVRPLHSLAGSIACGYLRRPGIRARAPGRCRDEAPGPGQPPLRLVDFRAGLRPRR